MAEPFRKPDAASGGARTREEARRLAEEAAGRELVELPPRWAAAWARVLTGAPPWPTRRAAAGDAAAPPPVLSPREGTRAWALAQLGLAGHPTVTEVKAAFRVRALSTHPDRGGTESEFIAAKRAHDVALAAASAHAHADRPRPRRRSR